MNLNIKGCEMLPGSVASFSEDLPEALKLSGLFPEPVLITGPTTEPMVTIKGQQVLQFCTGNYLGLARHQEVIQATKDGLDAYGMTSSGSRLVCGTQSPHLNLEKAIALWQGCEDSVLYHLVTVANAAAIPAFMSTPLSGLLKKLRVNKVNGKRTIFADWQSHPSVMDACVQAVGRENIQYYHHCDMDNLEAKLQKSDAAVKMIVTDGMFSADGDLAPLDEIVVLAKAFEAILFVDDAHGVGLLGENGRGTWEHYGVTDDVDVKIGSLAKSFAGGLGGFAVGSQKLADYLRVSGGHYIFGGSIPPAIAMGISKSIAIATAEPWRRKTVLENAAYLRDQLRRKGFGVLGDVSPIVPIVVGCSEKALLISKGLWRKGIFVPAFRYPATPVNKARLRVTLMATHTREQVDTLIETFVKVAEENGVTP